MKTKFTLAVLIVILVGLACCTPQKDKYHLLKIRLDKIDNDSMLKDDRVVAQNVSGPLFMLYFSNEEGDIYLPVQENDLLLILNFKSSGGSYYEYHKKDGKNLEFTMNDSMAYLNGNLIFFDYTGTPASIDKLQSLSDDDIRHLKYLSLSFDSVSEDISPLERVARINPRIGLFGEVWSLWMVIDKFQPEILNIKMNHVSTDSLIDQFTSGQNLETLVIEEPNPEDINKILLLPNLRQLIVNFDEYSDTNLALIDNPSLEVLTLNFISSRCPIKNLNFLGNLKNLRRLNIIGCDSLMDISVLKGFKSLESINLSTTGVTSGLNALNENHSLASIYFPYGTSQREFNEFISGHRELQFVGLSRCKKITDFSPLLSLKNLDYLIISPLDSGHTASALKGFESLDYLSVGPLENKDSTLIPEIKSVLPGTIINENSGLCLGSGYLLLVIPLILVFSLIFMIYRMKISRMDRHEASERA